MQPDLEALRTTAVPAILGPCIVPRSLSSIPCTFISGTALLVVNPCRSHRLRNSMRTQVHFAHVPGNILRLYATNVFRSHSRERHVRLCSALLSRVRPFWDVCIPGSTGRRDIQASNAGIRGLRSIDVGSQYALLCCTRARSVPHKGLFEASLLVVRVSTVHLRGDIQHAPLIEGDAYSHLQVICNLSRDHLVLV